MCEHPSDVISDREVGIMTILCEECIRKVESLPGRLFDHDMEEYGFCQECIKAIEKEMKQFWDN